MTLSFTLFDPDFHRSIQDNIFADVTFESFGSDYLEAIGPFAFNNTGKTHYNIQT